MKEVDRMVGSRFDLEIDYTKIGRKIQKLRNMQSLTQAYVAGLADISLSHMSNIETAKTKPSLVTLSRISRILGCTLDELVFDDEITLRFKQLKVLGISDEFEIRVFEDFVDSVKKNKKYLKGDDRGE